MAECGARQGALAPRENEQKGMETENRSVGMQATKGEQSMFNGNHDAPNHPSFGTYTVMVRTPWICSLKKSHSA